MRLLPVACLGLVATLLAPQNTPALGGQADSAQPKSKSVTEWVKQLSAPQPDARKEAAESLARFGPAAEPAIPDLLKALKDSEYPVFRAAARALTAIGKPAIPHLIRALGSGNGVPFGATVALADIGEPA